MTKKVLSNMHKNRLIAIMNTINANPDSWNQSQWHCSTSHCFCGWGVVIFGDEQTLETSKEHNSTDWHVAWGSLNLGLPRPFAALLFYHDRSLADLNFIVNALINDQVSLDADFDDHSMTEFVSAVMHKRIELLPEDVEA